MEATPINTPGMGNVVPGEEGSGDTFDNGKKKKKKKKPIDFRSFIDFKTWQQTR